ncbi:MAG: tetratricopeptide repeat protein [Parcubacteria group bacterium]|nr:tetratricopeptide repeat protein [Parcubacteria group bacterium]
MALDIAKFGRKPYQKLEQPEARDASGVHIRRYFSGLFGRLLAVFSSGGAFLTLAWVWDAGAAPGFGRSAAWLIFSGAIFVVFCWRALLSRELAERAVSPAQYRTVALLAVSAVGVFGIGSFARLGLWGALGFSTASPQLSFLGAALGLSWLFAILYGLATVRAIKQLLVSIFLGSTVLAGYLMYTLVFAGGYSAVPWVQPQGVLLVFAAAVFLMVAFAIFQKRSVKLLWSASIVLHLAVLFAWDAPSAWLVLIAGISALLAFQMLYSKKLWQRNFIYPLQVWALSAFFLIIPVKTFTSVNVPRDSVLTFAASRGAVSEQGFSWFGQGLGRSDEYALVSNVSFDDFGTLDGGNIPVVGHGYVQAYLESGILGVLALVALLAAPLLFGIRFWRANMRAFKEGTMSEGAYLGAIALLALALLAVGLWFFPFSFLTNWMGMLLAGSAMVLMHAGSRGPEEAKQPAPAASRSTRGLQYPLRLAVALITVAYVVFFVFQVRAVAAAGAARAAANQADAQARAGEWQRIVDRAPWNPDYRLAEAATLVDLLAAPLSIDAQRAALERITSVLSSQTRESGDPIAHWRAARLYGRLEAYAEGSALLGREEYQKAQALWPENVALPVALSEFYRNSIDALSSGRISAAQLRVEARDGLVRSLEIAPDYLPARLEHAFLVEQEEGIAAALTELEPWEDASPQIAYHVARLYLNDGSLEQAVDKLVVVINQVPNHSNAHYSLGVAYFRLGRYQESLDEFSAVLELNPESSDVQAKIEQVREKLGE